MADLTPEAVAAMIEDALPWGSLADRFNRLFGPDRSAGTLRHAVARAFNGAAAEGGVVCRFDRYECGLRGVLYLDQLAAVAAALNAHAWRFPERVPIAPLACDAGDGVGAWRREYGRNGPFYLACVLATTPPSPDPDRAYACLDGGPGP